MSDNIDTSEFQLQDEFTENDDQSTLIDIQLSSGVIRLQTFQFLKYSVAFQKECFSNDKSNNLIEKLQHVRENSGISEKSLITFIKLLRDEKINITNDQFCDLCYLSDTFKVKLHQLAPVLLCVVFVWMTYSLMRLMLSGVRVARIQIWDQTMSARTPSTRCLPKWTALGQTMV